MKVIFAFCLLKDRARDWWDEVYHTLGSEAVETMTWEDFVMRYRDEFTLVIEV